MIQLKKEDSRSYSLAEACVDVKFRVPTGVEAEIVFADQTKDSDIFKQFVLEVKSKDIEGWDKGIAPADVVELPGTWGLVHLVAVDLVNSMRMGAERKN